MSKREAFTLFEVLVAVSVSVIVVGVVMMVWSRTERFRRNAEKRLRYMAQWQAFQSMFEREAAGMYDHRGDEFGGAAAFSVTGSGHRLEFVSAVENPGPTDFVKITYYVVRNPSDPRKDGLYRKVWFPGDSEPMDFPLPPGEKWKWRCFPDVQGFTVSPEGGGSPPPSVTVTMTFADPMEPDLSVWTCKQTFEVGGAVP